MGDNVSLFAAFGAGFLSFISPCVLPLIPGYLSFVSGVSLEEMRSGSAATSSRRQVLITSLAFVLGFSIVFIALGASATALGRSRQEPVPAHGRRRPGDRLRPAHDGRVPNPAARDGKARAVEQASGALRRGARRDGVRIRLDAVHRTDPGEAFSSWRGRRTRSAKASPCWPCIRSGSACRSS